MTSSAVSESASFVAPKRRMRVAIGAGAPGNADAWKRQVEFVCEAERLGVAVAWSAEAWGGDAITPLAYLAAKTERIQLGSGIVQISARVPVMTAMTALSMAALSDNRFILGLGTSGPQVVEGLHGRPFAHPAARLRETIEIVRMACAGEKIVYKGDHHELPLPGGEGKALRLSVQPNDQIPIWLATLSPRTLELTGELADGWLGTSFVPETGHVMVSRIAKGAERAGRSLLDVDLAQGGDVAFSDDVERLVASRKRGLAFSLGGMGSATTNFYNNAYARQGWDEVADRVRRLWVDGKRDEAAAAVPDDMVLATSMIGTEQMVKDRMRAFRDAGISTLRVGASGRDFEERVQTLGRAMQLIEELNEELDPAVR